MHWMPYTLLITASLTAVAAPARAQWTRVTEIPANAAFALNITGDTLLVGQGQDVFVSTDAGATWKQSAPLVSGSGEVDGVAVHNGRLYAGTLNMGVFVSDDLGGTWVDFNQGLGGLGALSIRNILIDGNKLYLATNGAGPWVRNLDSGAWTHIGTVMEAFQASNMDALAAGASRIFACGGFNGTVFTLEPGKADWTVSLLFNDRLAPGLAGLSVLWTGHRWLVNSNIGIFHSISGHEPWTYADFGLRSLTFTGLTMSGPDVYASMGAGNGTLLARSHDDGVTWETFESQSGVQTFTIAFHRSTLYAARADGLWRRMIDDVDVPSDKPSHLAFAIVGPTLVGDHVRFAFELPEAGPVTIEVFDVAGRRAGETIRDVRPAGHGEVEWNAAPLAAGVYLARFVAPGGQAATRLVRLGR